jgi:transcriptional regulator with XRE-family HTH domain
MSLSERLKFARENMGKNQKEMAKTIKVSLTAWQNYESGKQIPGGKVFEELVRLGFNANWILTGDGPEMNEHNGSLADALIVNEQPAEYGKTNNLADPLDLAYLYDWHKLSDVGRMRVWTIVKEEIERERGLKDEK